MAKQVNDLISLIASQDQPGCSPGTLSGVGEPCFFPTNRPEKHEVWQSYAFFLAPPPKTQILG